MVNEVAHVKSLKFKKDYFYYNNISYCLISLVLMFFSPLLFVFFVSLFSPFVSRNILALFSPFVLVFAILFYSSLQPFSDLAEYMNVYHQVYNGDINIFDYERFGYGFEVIILIIMKITAYVSSGNDQFFIFTVYTIILSYIYMISLCINRKFHLLIFLSIFSSLGFVESLSYFLRQNLSVVFFLYGLLCTKRKKVRYFYFFLSFTSHISALINILVYVFAVNYKKRVNTPQRAIKVFVVALILMVLAVSSVFFLPYGKVLYDKAIYVINNSQYSILPLPYILITLANMIFVVLFSTVYRQVNTIVYYLMIKEIVFFLITIPLPAVPNRLGMIIFSYASIFLFSMYYLNISSIKKYLIILSFITINSIPFIYSMYIVSGHGNDFTFFVNKPFNITLLELVEYFSDSISNGVKYIDNGNSL